MEECAVVVLRLQQIEIFNVVILAKDPCRFYKLEVRLCNVLI